MLYQPGQNSSRRVRRNKPAVAPHQGAVQGLIGAIADAQPDKRMPEPQLARRRVRPGDAKRLHPVELLGEVAPIPGFKCFGLLFRFAQPTGQPLVDAGQVVGDALEARPLRRLPVQQLAQRRGQIAVELVAGGHNAFGGDAQHLAVERLPIGREFAGGLGAGVDQLPLQHPGVEIDGDQVGQAGVGRGQREGRLARHGLLLVFRQSGAVVDHGHAPPDGLAHRVGRLPRRQPTDARVNDVGGDGVRPIPRQ